MNLGKKITGATTRKTVIKNLAKSHVKQLERKNY